MRQARSRLAQTTLALVFGLFFPLMAAGQQAATVAPRITQPVDLENLSTLRGNTHPLARPEYDQGAAPDSLPMERILLVLKRSPEQETALRTLLDEQQIKSSPNYHMWLTPEQFGEQFGPADADILAVTSWLSSQGFQVNRVAAGRTVIEFSGTAGQVRQAFHTEIHKYVVNGEEHWANASDPQIPAALTPVVAGFTSLNNFPKRARMRRLGTFSRSKATGEVRPLTTIPATCPTGVTGPCYVFGLGPTDFATIYNVTPLWNASIDGTGQTIAIVSDSNINIQDVRDFRSMFGLPANDPNIILNGPDPGIGPDEDEADLDVQWTGAIAKGATVDFVVSENTETTAGVDLSALYIIDNNIASVMNSSYGNCEAADGAGALAFYNTIWEQGAAQGITISIAAGDSGSAGCDDSSFETAAQYGLAVGGDASTPFNVAVGGTDFNDSGSPSTYWSQTNNSTTQSSAKSYIPEMTWNDSCASSGSLTGCASGVASDGSDLVAGSGGQSNCAYPVSVAGGVECSAVGGIYGIPKPAWQSGTGVPNDRVRDTPDVSLFSGDGLNGSFYIYCEIDANTGPGSSTSSCDLNSPYLDFQGAGGTSASAQVFGGLMALVNQKYGRQGNANYVLYPLAAKSGASCASTSVMAPNANSSSCIFYDIQVGNNSVACDAGSPNCGNQSASGYGIEVYTGGSSPVPAWLTTAGFDLATGLGTVNVANLVNNWNSVSFTSSTTTLSITPITLTHGQSASITVSVTPSSATGDVSLIGGPNSSNLGIGFLTLTNGTNTSPTVMLPGGTYAVTARYAGNGTYGASESSPVSVTVNPENSQTRVELATIVDCNGDVTYGTTSITYGQNINCSGAIGSNYFLRVDVMNSSGNTCWNTTTGIPSYQCPTGTVTVTENNQPIVDLGAPASNTPGTYTLNSQAFFDDFYVQLPGGSDTLAAGYSPSPASPNNSYNSSKGTAVITVAQASTTISVTASPTTTTSGQPVTLTATVSTSSIGFAPSGAVQFLNSGQPINGTVAYTYANAPTSATNPFASLTATLTTSFTSTATITAQYVADINYSASTSSPLTVTITAGAPSFSVVASPTSFNISSPGASGTTTISITAINGFTGNVSLTCSVPASMTESSCSLASSTLTPTTTTTLTVNTTAPSAVIGLFNSPRWLAPLAGAIIAAFFLLLIPTKRRQLKLAFGTLFLVLLAAGVVACGGGSSSTGPPPNGGTPTGSYTVTVTGSGSNSSGNISSSVNITVTVQ